MWRGWRNADLHLKPFALSTASCLRTASRFRSARASSAAILAERCSQCLRSPALIFARTSGDRCLPLINKQSALSGICVRRHNCPARIIGPAAHIHTGEEGLPTVDKPPRPKGGLSVTNKPPGQRQQQAKLTVAERRQASPPLSVGAAPGGRRAEGPASATAPPRSLAGAAPSGTLARLLGP
jgi:hypothetical protein